ncbi:MAG: dTMP kinase [Desulfarculus sp.]|nr:dTMP kinase [Pseudomonadota bacterium]MBV1714985.1 dTMP kinase [Desulfarculus sp.]MBU4573909.1 dTMP kinase [Pseudomonadota bacterium]MBU4598962.1 dTMP kinase [Pseudomonadota bacterium]MBV1737485.1 dTMP kinase [Desulfarculus sp.]
MALEEIKAVPPFITLEGGEGVGKSTQQRMLVRRARGLGLTVTGTREPGATQLGASVRDLLTTPGNDHPGQRSELLLYLADRAQHVERVIAPALEGGQVVICDRFADSSEVYQGRARGLGVEWVRGLNRWACGEVWPDLTILLDLEPGLGLRRVNKRQGELGLTTDRLENEGLEFHRQVRQGFLDQAAAEPERIKVVDASMPQDEVALAVWALAEPLLKEFKRLTA